MDITGNVAGSSITKELVSTSLGRRESLYPLARTTVVSEILNGPLYSSESLEGMDPSRVYRIMVPGNDDRLMVCGPE